MKWSLYKSVISTHTMGQTSENQFIPRPHYQARGAMGLHRSEREEMLLVRSAIFILIALLHTKQTVRHTTANPATHSALPSARYETITRCLQPWLPALSLYPLSPSAQPTISHNEQQSTTLHTTLYRDSHLKMTPPSRPHTHTDK